MAARRRSKAPAKRSRVRQSRIMAPRPSKKRPAKKAPTKRPTKRARPKASKAPKRKINRGDTSAAARAHWTPAYRKFFDSHGGEEGFRKREAARNRKSTKGQGSDWKAKPKASPKSSSRRSRKPARQKPSNTGTVKVPAHTRKGRKVAAYEYRKKSGRK